MSPPFVFGDLSPNERRDQSRCRKRRQVGALQTCQSPALFFAGIWNSLRRVNLRPALLIFLVLAFFTAGLGLSWAAAPVVSNVRSVQRAGTQLVDIDYDLADPDSATLAVTVVVSTNSGATYDFPATSFSGALGNTISPGMGKRITWNAGQDWPNKFSANVRFRITAGAIDFAARPAASEWSTRSITGTDATLGNAAAVINAVQTNVVAANTTNQVRDFSPTNPPAQKIGRASCRERV